MEQRHYFIAIRRIEAWGPLTGITDMTGPLIYWIDSNVPHKVIVSGSIRAICSISLGQTKSAVHLVFITLFEVSKRNDVFTMQIPSGLNE